jgi:hypothetical protein
MVQNIRQASRYAKLSDPEMQRVNMAQMKVGLYLQLDERWDSGHSPCNRQTPKDLSPQTPFARVHSSDNRYCGAGQEKGGRSKLSGRQSPLSQSEFTSKSGNVVVISHIAPASLKDVIARNMLEKDR